MDLPDITLPCLSIRQPWAFAIIAGGKDIENRVWSRGFRGRFNIHAGKTLDEDDIDSFRNLIEERKIPAPWTDGIKLRDLPLGGIVGEAEIVGCVMKSDSLWFVGPHGFVIRNAKPVQFLPCRGVLGFFKLNKTADGGYSPFKT